MLNFKREEDIPASLQKEEIKEFISNYIKYKNDPENIPKPEKPISYRHSDLLDAFDRSFFSKCYLTEQKFENSFIMDIEHFVPQNEDGTLIYEWTNLFPAEHYTNMIKPRKTPTGGYLNPCADEDDVEKEIVYSLSTHGFKPSFFSANDDNVKAKNTCELLDRLHNGHDENTYKATESLRHAIHKKYIDILKTIIEYRSHPSGSQEKHQAFRDLRDLLSRKSSFTMLSRSIPAVSLIEENILD